MTKKAAFEKLFTGPKDQLCEVIIRSYGDLHQAPEMLYSVLMHADMCSFACTEIEDKDLKIKTNGLESLLKHATSLKETITTIKDSDPKLMHESDKTISVITCPFKAHPSYKSKIEPLLNQLLIAADKALYFTRELSDAKRSKSSGSNPANVSSGKRLLARLRSPFGG